MGGVNLSKTLLDRKEDEICIFAQSKNANVQSLHSFEEFLRSHFKVTGSILESFQFNEVYPGLPFNDDVLPLFEDALPSLKNRILKLMWNVHEKSWRIQITNTVLRTEDEERSFIEHHKERSKAGQKKIT